MDKQKHLFKPSENEKFNENVMEAAEVIYPLYKKYGIIVLEEAVKLLKERHYRQER